MDLGQTIFHLVALGEHNKVLIRKKCSRAQLLAYTANLPLGCRKHGNMVNRIKHDDNTAVFSSP